MKLSSILLALTTFAFPVFLTLQGAIGNSQQTTKVQSSLHKIKSGDTLYSILQSNGYSQAEAGRLIASLPEVNKYVLVPNNVYKVLRNGQGVHLRFYEHDSDLTYNFVRTPKGQRAYSEMGNFKVKVTQHKGKIQGSLVGSIQRLVANPQVAYRFMDAFQLEYDLRRDIVRDAKFGFTVERKYDGEHFVRYGEVTWAFLEIQGKLVEKNFIRFEEGGAFVNENDLLSNRYLHSPVNYIRISSLYQPRRRHPITKRLQPHYGIDFELPTGAPILAAEGGIVLRSGRGRASGYYVVISHGKGRETYYNHLNSISPHIKRGVRVKGGEKIGENGCTGWCTKPHLHFAYKVNDQWQNPAKHLRPYPKTVYEKLAKKIAQK